MIDYDASMLFLSTVIAKLSTDRSKGDGNGGGRGGSLTMYPSAFNPMGYCQYHGYKYKHGHINTMCNKRKTCHQVTAKQGDIQGGAI